MYLGTHAAHNDVAGSLAGTETIERTARLGGLQGCFVLMDRGPGPGGSVKVEECIVDDGTTGNITSGMPKMSLAT